MEYEEQNNEQQSVAIVADNREITISAECGECDNQQLPTVIKVGDQEVAVSDYPDTIAKQVSKLNVFAKKVAESEAKGDKLAEASKKVAEMKVKWNNKKASIEELQAAFLAQSDASESMLDVVKESFSCMQQLTNATKFLFALGVTNMAANRTVIRELELKLQNASKYKLDKLAQDEIRNVLNQLRAQEVIFTRLEKAEEKIKKINKETIPCLEGKVSGKLAEIQNRFKTEIDKKMSTMQDSINDLKSTLDSNQRIFVQSDKRQRRQAVWVIVSTLIAVAAVLLHFVPIK